MGSTPVKKINQRLPSGETLLTEEDLSGLLPKYITTRKELNDAESKNNAAALKKYFLSKKKFQFTIYDLYKVHKEMFGNVWSWAGKKRTSEKNIGVEKNQIDIELKKLIGDLKYWLDKQVDIIEISARLHHRLVHIHPFNNGNGRWARFIVNLFLKEKLNAYLNFPEDEITSIPELRKKYIAALKEADSLNYQSLIELHHKYILNFE
jgi:Fic-DOC domain mobile mystery protein B